MDQTHIVALHGLLDLRLELALVVLNVLVALHRVRLTSTCLTIRKNCRVVAVNYLLDHAFDSDLLIKGPLVDSTVRHLVELVSLGRLVTSVELERDGVLVMHHLHGP